MNTILREIDNRIAAKKIEFMKKEIDRMNNQTDENLKKLVIVDTIYNKILLKDQPVGSSIKAIRHLR